MNLHHYRLVMHRIWADLRSYDQGVFHDDPHAPSDTDCVGRWRFPYGQIERPAHYCGSTHCVAGWAQVLSGARGNAFVVGESFLGLDTPEATWLFDSKRTLEELKAVLKCGGVREYWNSHPRELS